jgi:hypothetical protein
LFLIEPESGIVRGRSQRRRTPRHRRNRAIRRGLFVLTLALFVGGFSGVVLRHFASSLFRSSQANPEPAQAEDSRARLLQANQDEAFRSPIGARPVYPYSVVPGGIEDARELKWVAEHDPVVAAHYAGFDYDHARVVRLVLARTAYLSYRIGNHVYWTRRRIKLRKGEKVITDGKITGRARCANRIEEVPRQATSSSEPPAAKFDEPMHPAEGTAAQIPPVPFQSALLNRPGVPGVEATGPLTLYRPLSGGGWAPFAPPPFPGGGVCAPGKKGEKPIKGKKNPCGGPATVPEPGTWLLLASGLMGLYWNTRRKLTAHS